MARKVKTEAELQNPQLSAEEQLIAQAKDHFDAANDHWLKYRDTASDCLRFVYGDYLDKNYINMRMAAGLPILTENRVPAFLEGLTNEFRKHIPAIQVEAANEQTDPQFATQMADQIRTIETDSRADVAYGKAGWYAIGTGLGYVRVLNEYEGDDSFKQKLCIAPVEDPFTIFPDPNHKCVTGSDMEYAFVVVDMTHDDYIRKYGKGKLVDLIQSARIHGWNRDNIKSGNKWLTKNTVRVAEYYVKEYHEKTLWFGFDRTIGANKTYDEKPSGNVEIIDDRVCTYPVVKHYVINDKEILEDNEWPGQFIPIVAFKGTEFWNQSERMLKGMVHDMRDPQKRVDYFINWQAEIMMLAPKAPYIGTATQFEDNQHEWQNINVSNQAYITFKPDPQNPEKPARDVLEVPVQGSQTLLANAVEGLKAVTGMQAPMTGEQQNETPESGRAVLARIEQSHTATYHYQDNIRHSIAQVGRVLLEAMPVFYGENARQVMATKANGEQYMATMNDSTENMLSQSKFKVAIESGGTYATKRQAEMDAGMALMGIYPQAAPLVADLVVQNADWPGAREMAARLRSAVPPTALAATQDMDKQEAPQQIANLTQQVQSLTQALQKMQAEVAPDKAALQKAEMEKAFAQHDNQWELEKTKLEHQYEMKKLEIEENKIILEGKIKEQELALARRDMAIKEAELKMKATVAGAEIASDAMDHHHKFHEATVSTTEPADVSTGPTGDLGTV